MAQRAPGSLPDAPSLEWLRKEAKRRLEELRRTDPGARLAAAQFDLAKQYGFSSWRALKAHVDSLTVEGRLFEAAREGDVEHDRDAVAPDVELVARPQLLRREEAERNLERLTHGRP